MSAPIAKKQKIDTTPSVKNAETRSQQMEVLTMSIFNVVVSNGIVHWHDALRLGGTCKEMKGLWRTCRDTVMEELLVALEKKNSCNKYSYCEEDGCNCGCVCNERSFSKVFYPLDPRANAGYENMSIYAKCKQLASFTSTLVAKYRSYFDYDRLTDFKSLPSESRFDESEIFLDEAMASLLEKEPKRLAFVFHIIAATMGSWQLQGSSLNDGVCRSIMTMLAGGDKDICAYLKRNDVTEVDRVILGPVLTQKLDLLAPFFDEHRNPVFPADLKAF
jgi:hypothetical protein